jgi:uncharacterized membrane protein
MKFLNSIKENYLLTLILLLAVFLRFYHLDFQSIWLDEIHTMIETNPKLTFQEFKTMVTNKDGMGHVYFFFVRTFHQIFGYCPHSARMYSALIGVLAVFAMYILGKTLKSKNAGLIAAVLLCVNYYAIFHSQEARPYISLLLVIVVSFTRLIIFIRNKSVKNAIIYGLVTGLIVNTHFVGLTTIFSQGILFLFLFFTTDNNKKLDFFKKGLISLLAAISVAWSSYEKFLIIAKYKSGWLQLPGPDGISNIFREFLGSTELLNFIFTAIFVFLLIKIFNIKELKYNADVIINNKLLLSTLIIFTWIFLPLLLPIIKSYTSEPMILSRYLIGLLPGLILALAIGIDLIKNKISKILLISVIVSFALVDLILIKEYYTKVTKTQFREVTDFIKERNTNQDKTVSTYGWLMSHFLNQPPKHEQTIESSLSSYVNLMQAKAISMESFWYLDGNSLPYNLAQADEQFLLDNFTQDISIDRFDAWAKHYTAKIAIKKELLNKGTLSIKDFSPLVQDGTGNMMFFESSNVVSSQIYLEKGNYSMLIMGNSLPAKPIKGENAHIKVRMNGTLLEEFYLSENKNNQETKINFKVDDNKQVKFQIGFDNDISLDGLDRNAVIYSIKLDKTN